MRRTYKRGTKAKLSFSGGPHAPVNMAESMEEVNVGGKKPFPVLYCAIFRSLGFRKSLKLFGTSITSLDPETVQLPAFSILSAMFKGACGPPEKLSVAVVPRSNVLRMIMILANWFKVILVLLTPVRYL